MIVYESLLSKNFSELANMLATAGKVDSIRRTITILSNAGLDTISQKSDTVIWFDRLDELSTLMLLVERIDLEESKLSIQDISKSIRTLNESDTPYYASVQESENENVVDVVVLVNNLYKVIQE